jgi:outer membrane immunogenic protein
VYGVDVGVDVPLGDNFVLGAEAFSTNPFETERTIGAAARLGYAVSDNWLVYTRAGYTNYKDFTSRKLDGLTVGGGVEYALNSKMYAKVEYRYSDFEQNIGNHGALVGVGLRF